MALPKLPSAIAEFFRAANGRDTAGLLTTLAEGAVVTDMGEPIDDDGFRRWSDDLFVQSNMAVRPVDVVERESSTIVSVIAYGARPGSRTQLRCDWKFTIDGTQIAALDIIQTNEPDLPPAVAAFVQATNARDLEGMLAAFAEDAMVNDDLQERWGNAAIRNWAEHEFIGENVNIFVVKCIRHRWIAVVMAHVDGDFDQRGLPYPLVLTFYFSIDGEKVVQLIILRNQSD